MEWFCADFETSNSPINIEKNYSRVWLWDIFDHEKRFHYNGYDIETFFDELFGMKSCIIYFHNLKFDGAFIIDYLLKNGFKIDNSKKNMTISTLITDRLVWYTFTVYYCGRQYKFRDSLKKITTSLEQAAEDFGLDIRKGSIDYQKHRDFGYIPTEEEIDYIHIDTEIMADILQYYYDNDMTKMTNASDAITAYKSIINEKGFRNLFPVLIKPIDDFIRRSYKGGYCYVNPKFKNIDLQNIYCYDVKSMYPSVMVESDLPYGVPIHYEGKYEYDESMPLYIQRIQVCCDLKDGRIPTIQTKSFMSIKLNYLKSTEGRMLDLYLTSVDLERFLEDYDIWDIKYIEGFKFYSSRGLFEEYIMKYFTLKESSKGAKKQLYKIFLNSLYGKFAMMTERRQAIPTIVNGQLKFERTPYEEEDAIYTAVASFITANARKKLHTAIYKNLDVFVYCDTDSIHLLAPARDIDEGKTLGKWAIEHGKKEDGKVVTYVNKGRYLGQKCYILCEEKDGNELEIKKVAGAPQKVKEQINWDNFHINFQSDKNMYPKYRVKRVDGGVVLVPTEFTIKDRG